MSGWMLVDRDLLLMVILTFNDARPAVDIGADKQTRTDQREPVPVRCAGYSFPNHSPPPPPPSSLVVVINPSSEQVVMEMYGWSPNYARSDWMPVVVCLLTDFSDIIK